MRKLLRFTPEKREEFKKKRLESKSKLTLACQLGYYVGEKIFYKYLPTLSVDMLQTRNVISVTAGEGDECRRLKDVWYNKSTSFKGTDEERSKATEAEWLALRAYHEMLEAKYLKPTIDCRFQLLNVTEADMADFKKGLGSSLWNSDLSHYSTKAEDIDVKADEDGWFTVITLKRD